MLRFWFKPKSMWGTCLNQVHNEGKVYHLFHTSLFSWSQPPVFLCLLFSCLWLFESCMDCRIWTLHFLLEYSFEREVKWAKSINQPGWWAPAKKSCQWNTKIHRKRKTTELKLWLLQVICNQNIKVAEPRIDLTWFFSFLFPYSLSWPYTMHTRTHTFQNSMKV